MDNLLTFSERTLQPYLGLDSNIPESLEHAFSFAQSYLMFIRGQGFDNIPVSPRTIFHKYNTVIKRYHENYAKEIISACNNLKSSMSLTTPDIRLKEARKRLQILYDLTTESYVEAIEVISSNNTQSPFTFISIDSSDKYNAVLCLKEARKLILADNLINNRAKTSLLKLIDKIINELTSEKTSYYNWFGKAREVIIILGALGSTLGGIAGVEALYLAEEKVIEAHTIIERTTVSNNFQLNIINNYITDHAKNMLLSPHIKGKEGSTNALPPANEEND